LHSLCALRQYGTEHIRDRWQGLAAGGCLEQQHADPGDGPTVGRRALAVCAWSMADAASIARRTNSSWLIIPMWNAVAAASIERRGVLRPCRGRLIHLAILSASLADVHAMALKLFGRAADDFARCARPSASMQIAARSSALAYSPTEWIENLFGAVIFNPEKSLRKSQGKRSSTL
jgi:hypothetical protein